MTSAASLESIMRVMGEAFDPAFGEAWTRRQISDALARKNTFCLLAHCQNASNLEDIKGFALSRQVLDEEELLLIAVRPLFRKQGVGTKLIGELCSAARARGSARLFLEMRAGNPAQTLYETIGFTQIGRRPGYYRGAAGGPLDALTFAFGL